MHSLFLSCACMRFFNQIGSKQFAINKFVANRQCQNFKANPRPIFSPTQKARSCFPAFLLFMKFYEVLKTLQPLVIDLLRINITTVVASKIGNSDTFGMIIFYLVDYCF